MMPSNNNLRRVGIRLITEECGAKVAGKFEGPVGLTVAPLHATFEPAGVIEGFCCGDSLLKRHDMPSWVIADLTTNHQFDRVNMAVPQGDEHWESALRIGSCDDVPAGTTTDCEPG